MLIRYYLATGDKNKAEATLATMKKLPEAGATYDKSFSPPGNHKRAVRMG